ncbi:unnamed protein product [Diplocarpon coronariae]
MSNRAGWGDNESAARTSPSRTRASTTDSRGKPPATSSPKRKRRAPGTGQASTSLQMSDPLSSATSVADEEPSMTGALMAPPSAKKSRTNTPWTAAEEQRLKIMRDAGNSWAEIAKSFPSRTEGSVKKHWYKDMHYAEFAEDESQALLNAIKEYETNKWKEIGKKVGKPAKACEQYAKENFGGKV